MWGYGSGWGWLGMGVGMTLFWALVILGVIFLARYLGGARDRRDFGINGGRSDAERILANRFARGEIDEEEYRKRRELIRGGGR
ncbi:hypothetical protein GCM10023321_47360 [Pseudonocardia eucalypti]|uniref:SHOCT domain-containing protein n=2 Tax=Pseudonocardia eucalypti TaxID=648755 RepID=A0ABP9QHW8_9PSEU